VAGVRAQKRCAMEWGVWGWGGRGVGEIVVCRGQGLSGCRGRGMVGVREWDERMGNKNAWQDLGAGLGDQAQQEE